VIEIAAWISVFLLHSTFSLNERWQRRLRDLWLFPLSAAVGDLHDLGFFVGLNEILKIRVLNQPITWPSFVGVFIKTFLNSEGETNVSFDIAWLNSVNLPSENRLRKDFEEFLPAFSIPTSRASAERVEKFHERIRFDWRFEDVCWGKGTGRLLADIEWLIINFE
jgi:hypothetical protein